MSLAIAFIYFCLCWVFVGAHRLPLVVVSRGYSSLQCPSSRHTSCMWDPPGPGIEPVSLALAGRLPTTGPPGKSTMLSHSYEDQGWNHLRSSSLTCVAPRPGRTEELRAGGATLSPSGLSIWLIWTFSHYGGLSGAGLSVLPGAQSLNRI